MRGVICNGLWNVATENEIGDDGAEHIARALEKNTTITTVDLSGSGSYYNRIVPNFGVSGAEHLARALKKNATITEIYLSGRWHMR